MLIVVRGQGSGAIAHPNFTPSITTIIASAELGAALRPSTVAFFARVKLISAAL